MRKLICSIALMLAAGFTYAEEQNPAEQLLNNGNMEQGEKAPDGWRLDKRAPSGVTMVLDKEAKHGGESSMKIDVPESAAGKTVKIQQEVKGVEGNKIRLSGFWKSTKDIKQVRIALQCFDHKWKQVSWKDMVFEKTAAGDWRKFDKTISIPDNARHPMLTIMVKTKGGATVWFDDLLFTESE